MKKLYLLLGQEHSDKNAFVASLKSNSLKGQFSETLKLSGEDGKGDALLSLFYNKPLFGGNRLLLVELADKINAKLVPPLVAAYNQTPDLLVLLCDENKLPAWENVKGVAVEKKVFYPLSEMDKKSYVMRLAREANRKMTNDGAEYFVLMAGTDKTAIDNLSQLIFPSLPEDKVIDATFLGDYLVHSRTETVYTLFYSILEGNLNLSLERLNSLLQARAEVVPLIANLIWQLRRLFSLATEGGSYGTFTKLRIFRNEKPYYDKALCLYSPNQIEAMLERVIAYDLVLREEKTEKQGHLLQTCLYELIVKKGEALESFREDLPLLP